MSSKLKPVKLELTKFASKRIKVAYQDEVTQIPLDLIVSGLKKANTTQILVKLQKAKDFTSFNAELNMLLFDLRDKFDFYNGTYKILVELYLYDGS